MTRPTMYRQGDVLVIMVPRLPARATIRPATPRGVVLAEGEVTGHAHTLPASTVRHYDAPDAAAAARQLLAEAGLTFEVDEASPVSFLELDTAAPLVHQEHATITLPAGRAIVVRQREYTPARAITVGD